jgi:GT2 family glycosyltransferase/glycosyltransferase involved in cell wall biosynthesis
MPGWTTEQADVVVLGIVPWTARWQRPQHLARELTRRGHRVAYVTPHFVVGRQRWRELDENTCPERIVLAQLSTIEKETIHDERGWTRDDVAHAHHTFWRLVDDLRLRCPILVVQSPAWWPLVSWLRERTDFPVVYDCLDEHTGWNQANAAELRVSEEELARSADLVLASASPLEERMRTLSANVVSVPNGCDFEHFEGASEPNAVLRPPLDGPIVGYYGAISAGWFDAALVVALAESRPDWNIVLIGPIDAETRTLLDPSPNIVQLGEVAYAELPRYCADFDVAIIPFLANDLTAATDPVKLYEYFAAGKPVVTTPLPAVYPLQGPLVVADTAPGFERAIESFLREPGDAGERREIARAASWDRRVDAFYDRLVGCLPSLDVVVLTHNGVDLTRRCLASIEADASYRARLVVVDNASTDGTGDLLDELDRRGEATVLRNTTNAGFSAGLNQGIRAGSSHYVLVLNNDTELPKGALLAFVNGLARSREIGLLGPVTNSIGNEAEIYTPYDIGGEGELSAWFRGLAWDRFGMQFDLDAAALFAAIVRREDLEAVGGLPEHYQVGMFEDDELAERLRGLGKRVVCAEDVFVHHFGAAAFRRIDPVVYQAIFDRNRRVYEATVDAPWRPHSYRPDKTAPMAKSDMEAPRRVAGSHPARTDEGRPTHQDSR